MQTRLSRIDLVVGLGAIAFAILFNVPFSILGATFDYPDILRRPAGEVLDRFAAGGNGLILTWHSFAWIALLLVPLSFGLTLTGGRPARMPALAIGAAIAGSLAGLAQAIGLWRWVFVIPGLARSHAAADTPPEVRLAAEQAFALLNQYGGVAVGEHIGQLLTALFAAMLAAMQWQDRRRAVAYVGFAAAAAIAIGTTEGLAIALGGAGGAFALVTVAGFLVLSLWFLLTGILRLRGG
jgi:hypothetical protein